MATASELIGVGVPSVQAGYITDGRAPSYGNAGSTGNATINALVGTVQFAAAATSLTLTNNKISSSSFIFCTVQTNDTTAKAAYAVPGSGSATIYLNAAATGTTKVAFQVINP